MRVTNLVLSFLLVVATSMGLRAQTSSNISPKETACGDQSAKILILGVYHMDNPGQDAVNLQADDVLSAKRQRELAELVEKLARFQPTKIAIEAPYRNMTWPNRYKQFLAGEYKLGRNEVEQIGFQLSKRLNLSTLYPVDYPMWMNGWTPSEMELSKPNQKWANDQTAPPKTEGKPSAPEAQKKVEPPALSEEDKILRQSTITEYLRRLNSETALLRNHAGYMRMLLPTESIGIYARTDEVTNWYKRNLRIFTNLNRITDFGNDRILLIIGAGHLKILRDFAIDAPQYCLVEAETYLK